jgi:hypothetical protein
MIYCCVAVILVNHFASPLFFFLLALKSVDGRT